MKKLITIGLISGLFVFAGVAQASTVTVTGNTASGENQPGWLFNRDTSTQTPYEFNTGQAKIGLGSLFVLPITNTINTRFDKFIAENFLLTHVADITSISYDFRINGNGSAGQFYMNVYVNFGESSPTKFYDCRYDVVPSSGSNSAFTTVTFDPAQAYPVTTRAGGSASPHTCPASPSGMDALSTGSSTIRAIALNVGDTSLSDTGVSGYLDNVVVNAAGGITAYDFDPAPLVATINSPAPVAITNPVLPITVNVDNSVTNPTIDVSTLITASGTAALPQITIDSPTVDVAIPASTVVTSADTNWNGVIDAPTVVPAPAITADSGNTATAVLAIEVGSGDTALTFDRPVKLTLAGQAGNLVGWSRGGAFTQITDQCNSLTSPTLDSGADCKAVDGSDLVVWTKHFTTFVTYTQTLNPVVEPAAAPRLSSSRRNVGGGGGGAVLAQANAGEVLGAFVGPEGTNVGVDTPAVAAIKVQLVSLIRQLIAMLQSQLAAAIAAGGY